jgi:GNAT superfamily N-acetyltransferase
VTPTAVASPCELLEWDSEHFGFKIATVVGSVLDESTAALADDWSARNGVRCLYFLANPDDARTSRVAAEHGFRVVDHRLTVRCSLAQEPPRSGSQAVEVSEASAAELVHVRSIAARSHRGGGRFYFDGGFPPERCDALYEAWVDRGWNDPERILLVARVNGEPAAYQVVGPVERGGARRLELLAVDPDRHGSGVGAATLSGGMRLLHAGGTPETWTILSARNIVTVRLHERLGFLIEKAGIWHHKWYAAG